MFVFIVKGFLNLQRFWVVFSPVEEACEVSKIQCTYITYGMYFRQLQFSQLQPIWMLYSNSAAVLHMPPLLGPTARIRPYSQVTEKNG